MNNAKRKVLIADDEPGVRRLLREILCGKYDVLEAQNGREAVDVAIAEIPDLVLLDMIMPEMDGLTACRAIKDAPRTREVPVVIVSAVTHPLNKKLAENAAGASAYVTKPFSRDDVMTTVAELLSGVEGACDPAKADPTLIR
jgi:CheY-like chemotaxis protein